MTDLFAARTQMALSLGFHILFASAGIAMPLLMALAEATWLRTKDPVYLELAKRWAKGTAILFAVGAVSGTVLSFELGLLWPEFMRFAGPVIGMPFSLEGAAFFLEAIFLGVYLYGWDRVRPAVHLAAGFGVAVSGALSGLFVVAANAWMNAPTGFRIVDGEVVDIDPWAAMFNDAAFAECLHMTLAAYLAVSFAVVGIHASILRKSPDSAFHRAALRVALGMALVSAVLQPISGHTSAVSVAERQPAKLAAMEALWDTTEGAGLMIGGWPDMEAEQTRYGVEISYALSLLIDGTTTYTVVGLKDIPEDERPPVAVVHVAYQIMVGCGVTLALLALVTGALWARRREVPTDPWLLRALVLASPLGFLAIEAGWTVTEVGRQPWVVYGYLKTADAVTPVTGLQASLAVYTLVFVLLAVVVVALLRRHVFLSPDAWKRW